MSSYLGDCSSIIKFGSCFGIPGHEMETITQEHFVNLDEAVLETFGRWKRMPGYRDDNWITNLAHALAVYKIVTTHSQLPNAGEYCISQPSSK